MIARGYRDKWLPLASSSQDLIELCLRRDAELDRLLSGTRIFSDDLGQGDHLISCRDWLALVRNCQKQVASDDLPFLAAEALLANSDHTLFSLLQSARDLRDALRLWHRHRFLFLPLMQALPHGHDDGLALHLLPAAGLGPQENFVIHLTVSLILGLARHQAGECAGIEIALPMPRPADTETYALHWFQVPEFNAPCTRLLIPRALLRASFRDHDPDIHATQLRYCRARTSALDCQPAALEVIRRELKRALPANPGLAEIAKQLAMSGSSLKRLLKEHGVSYCRLVDEVRSELALALLRDPRLSNRAIASQLGFANEHNFRRAFKRWTGSLPSNFRFEGQPWLSSG